MASSASPLSGEELRFFLKHGGTPPIQIFMEMIKDQDGIVLMDGGGEMSAGDVAKLRSITCKLIWSRYPAKCVQFMDKDCNESKEYFKPADVIPLPDKDWFLFQWFLVWYSYGFQMFIDFCDYENSF